MTLKTAPESLWATGGGTRDHAAVAYRRLLKDIVHDTSGVVDANDFKVTAKGTPDFSVDIAAGSGWVVGTESVDQGAYHIYNDGTVNVPNPTPPHATLNRIDLIVVRWKDQDYSGVTTDPSFEWVAGTASGSPVPPAAPATSLVLAQVGIRAVGGGGGTIIAGDITDKRVRAHLLGEVGSYKARMWRATTGQSIANSSWTIIQYNTVDYDPNSNLTTGSGAKYTCPVAGLYLVTVGTGYTELNAGDSFAIRILKNSSDVYMGTQCGGALGAISAVASQVLQCAAGDIIQAQTYQHKADNSACTTVVGIGSTFLSVALIGLG